MTVPKGLSTAQGLMAEPNREKLAQFKSPESAVDDLILFLTTRWKYPRSFVSLDSMVDYMKQKGYFTDSVENYKKGVNFWYKKLGL